MSDMRTVTQTMEISPAESETIRVLLLKGNSGGSLACQRDI
jgi:hypothetical protein